jgi:PAS domain S-box-containing protein
MQNFHRLLQRQIKKNVPLEIAAMPEMKDFFESVNLAYLDFDRDHDQIELTLEISSNELFKSNQLLNQLNEDLEEKVKTRTLELEETLEVLLHEKQEREKQNAKQAYTDHLLRVSNDAIGEVIRHSNIDLGIKNAFESIAKIGDVDSIHLYYHGDSHLKQDDFKLHSCWLKNPTLEHHSALQFLLHSLLNEIDGVFMHELNSGKSVLSSKLFDESKGSEINLIDILNQLDFLALPIFIGKKLIAVSVFVKKRLLIWEPVHETILLNLSNSIGNLIHQKETEIEINNSRLGLLEAQKFSRIASFSIDFNRRICSFTEHASLLLNVDPTELVFDEGLVHRLRRNVHPEDLTLIDNFWQQSMIERKEIRLDFRILLEENQIQYLNWNMQPEFSESGELIFVRGTLQDISERKLLEDKASTAKLIIENSPAVLFRWKIAEHWPVLYVSSNISHFGYTEDDFISQRIQYSDIIHFEDLKRVSDEEEEKKLKGTLNYSQEYRIITGHGETRWVEDQTVVVCDDFGNALYHQGIILDITEEKIAKFALQESEQRFRSLVQNSTDITTILELDGTVRYVSPIFYRMFGYSPGDILGENVFDFIHEDDIQDVQDVFIELKNTKHQTNPIELRLRNKLGEWKYLESVGINLTDLPAVSGLVINSRDITERIDNEHQLKEYATSLEKINKELDQFAYIVSHDLKAPLRAINNLSTWIEEDIQDNIQPETQKNFSMLRGRIQRMEMLINGILQYSRAGRMKTESSTIDMDLFIKEVMSNIAPPENFKIKIQSKLPTIEGEKVVLDQVFSNLISNAIKYNDNPNPIIQIGYENQGSVLCFFVQDNGPGIDEQFHEKIFGIFQTLNSRDSIESTGVGLSIVKKIIEEKAGRVWVESASGKGSKFIFTLPQTDLINN